MSDHKVIQGTYSDFKIIKTRSVAQFIIEIPLENASHAIDMFGLPSPECEKWVAVAMLNEVSIRKDESAIKAIQSANNSEIDVFNNLLVNLSNEATV